jgi:ribonuclease H2 subunit A
MLLDKKPKASREDTIVALKRVIEGPHPHVAEGPLLVSDIPQDISDGVVMGIDEAGRGPVLGPMTYAAAFWKEGTKIPQGYNDSKQMTAEMRNKLFRATLESREIGFVVRVLHATEISQNMLRRDPYNLNAMSHDTAMSMIRCVLEAGVVIQKCYIDTVGREDPYKARLDQAFAGRGIEFVVEKKADAKYVQCSAASVCEFALKSLMHKLIQHI